MRTYKYRGCLIYHHHERGWCLSIPDKKIYRSIADARKAIDKRNGLDVDPVVIGKIEPDGNGGYISLWYREEKI